MTIKDHLWELLDELPSGRYGLWTLTDMLNGITGHRSMPHTVKRMIVDYCDIAGASFTCVVHNKSIYAYKQGYKISGALTGKD